MSDQISSPHNDGKNSSTSNVMEQVYGQFKNRMAAKGAGGKSVVSEEQKLHILNSFLQLELKIRAAIDEQNKRDENLTGN